MQWLGIVSMLLEALMQLKLKKSAIAPDSQEHSQVKANFDWVTQIFVLLPKLIHAGADASAVLSAIVGNQGWGAILAALQKMLSDLQGVQEGEPV